MDPVEYLPLHLMPDDGSRSPLENLVLHSKLLCIPYIIQIVQSLIFG